MGPSGVGLDLGTAFIMSARKTESGEIQTNRIRNAFLDVEKDARDMLKLRQTSFLELRDRVIILGEEAINVAAIFNRPARRPMAKGVISDDEDSQVVLRELIKSILGVPRVPNELCYYSIPAEAVDDDTKVAYHKRVFAKILREQGYTPVAKNEAYAICMSECAKEGFSGVTVSCILPGMRVWTRGGPKKIEDLVVGEEVLTRACEFSKLKAVVKKPFKGRAVSLKRSSARIPLKVTDEHEIWVYRDSRWQWIQAQNVKVGDFVAEPMLNRSSDLIKNFSIPRVGGSGRGSQTVQESFKLTYDLGRFLGYYLADGCSNSTSDQIKFGFGPDEDDYVEDVRFLAKNLFGRDCSEMERDDKAQWVYFYDVGLARWLDVFKQAGGKTFPYAAEKLPPPFLRGVICGLLRGDCTFYEESSTVSLELKSGTLAPFVQQALSVLGVYTSYGERGARDGGTLEGGRVIKGGAQQVIQTNKKFGSFVRSLVEGSWEHSERNWVMNSVKVTRVTEALCFDYEGEVLDLMVDGDPSFVTEGVTVHNCGAGMVNVCLTYATMPSPDFQFSVAQSGDWIDYYSAQSLRMVSSRVTQVKERGVNLMNVGEGEPRDLRVREAVVFHYEQMIEDVLRQINERFLKYKNQINLPGPIPLVIAGGTAQPKGFLEKFKAVFGSVDDFSIPISEIRLANDLNAAVAQGLLVCALNHDG